MAVGTIRGRDKCAALALPAACLYNAPVMPGRLTGAFRVACALLAAAAALGACSKKETPRPAPAEKPSAPARVVTMETMLRGARLFQENCAQCHGPEAQGHPDWQNPAVTAAPPLDGSGNAWQRRRSEIVAVIQHGAMRQGQPVMPGWEGRLSDKDVEDLVTWFTALWPSDVYERWQKVNAEPAPTKARTATKPKG
jgi:mono/diheme cytochrome c family protein